jgi:hypothetical protein
METLIASAESSAAGMHACGLARVAPLAPIDLLAEEGPTGRMASRASL